MFGRWELGLREDATEGATLFGEMDRLRARADDGDTGILEGLSQP
jgi:hypothetical protein